MKQQFDSPALERFKKIAEEVNQPLLEIEQRLKGYTLAAKAGFISQDQLNTKLGELREEAAALLGIDISQQFHIDGDTQESLADLVAGLNHIESAFIDITNPLMAFRSDLDAINILQNNGRISAEQYATALANLQLNTAHFLADQNAALGFVRTFTTEAAGSYADMFGQILDGEKTWSEAFTGILKNIRNEILRLLILKPIMDALFKGATGLLTGGASAIFGGGLAHGGRATSGRSFLVGEQGPELFTPGISGSVTPNGANNGNTIYIDARNSNGDADLERKIKSTIRDAAPFLADFAVKSIRDGGRHDPNFLR